MKVYVIQSKNGIIMNDSLRVKNYTIGVLVKMIIFAILAPVIVNVIKHLKLMII